MARSPRGRSDAGAAIAAYDAAIAANPRFAQAFASRGRIKQGESDHAGALADFDAALEVNRATFAGAGRALLGARADGGRRRSHWRARTPTPPSTADPRDTSAQLCRGLLQLRAEEWEGAREIYDAVLALESGNPTALFGRGIARRRAGDPAGREDMNLARDFDRHIGERFDDMGVETF